MFKKILLTFLSLNVLFMTLFVPAAKAQGPWYAPDFREFYIRVYDPDTSPDAEIFGERYTAAQVHWIFWTVAFLPFTLVLGGDLTACIMQFDDPLNFIANCGDELEARFGVTAYSTESDTYYADARAPAQNQSAIEFVQEYVQRNPMSGIGYVLDAANSLYLIPEAQAQGFGFGILENPVRSLWVVTRNMAYTLLVFVMIAFAFMVMFRVKSSPQTVVTIQSAIPKVILGAILITFSYAIGGFVIDLVYVVLGLIATLFTSGSSSILTSDWRNVYDFYTAGAFGLGMQGNLLLYFMLFVLTAWVVVFSVMLSLSVVAIFYGIILFVLCIPYLVIVSILLTFWSLKILWLLFKTYVQILLLIIVGPLYILAGIITPKMGIGAWLKQLASLLAVYPTVAVLFTLAFIFLYGAMNPIADLVDFVLNVYEFIVNGLASVIPGDNFDPPLGMLRVSPDLFSFGTYWMPPLTLGVAQHFMPLLWINASLLTIGMIPKAANMIQSAMSGQPFAFGTAIGEAIRQPVGYAQKGVSAVSDIDVRKQWGRLMGTIGRGRPGTPP